MQKKPAATVVPFKRQTFQHAPEITRDHADRFVERFFQTWADTGDIHAAVERSQVMTYSADVDIPDEVIAAQDAIVNALEDEIRGPLADAFRRAAAKALGVRAGG